MSERFFVESPIQSNQAKLVAAEAHHALHVLRAKPGDPLTLFDGSGAEFSARIARTGRQEIDCDVLERREIDRELPGHITLAVALPKGDRQRFLVEKCVELGVAQLIPLVTTRGVAQPTDQALERLRRSVIEASKQCRRNRLMQVAQPLTAKELFTAPPQATQRAVAHPAGTSSLTAWLRQLPVDAHTQRALLCAIGPEGGFTDEELALAQAPTWSIVHLGARILRVETAAASIAATIAAAWQD
jgi:16S rRNA (uracil1498-N3)-methyltransferase